MTSSITKTNKRIYNKMIKQVLDDYMVNELTYEQLSEKYHISVKTICGMAKDYEFARRKLDYQNQLLDKSVARLSTTHARVLSRLTDIMETQVMRIRRVQKSDKDKVLDPGRMKEVLTAFALLSKEHRLNTDQPTENNNITIKVEMGEGVPLISENHIINKKPDDVETESTVVDEPMIESPAVEEAIEVIVENQGEDDFVFGDLE